MPEIPKDASLRGKLNELATEVGQGEDIDGWIATVAKHVGSGGLRLATHVPKLTHPSAQATNFNLTAEDLPVSSYIGTRSLGGEVVPDLVAKSAAFLPGRLLEQLEHRGQPLHVLAKQRDPELLEILSDDPQEAESLAEQLGRYGETQAPLRSHSWLKGVFWRTGEDPNDDTGYRLLIPVPSSALSRHLYRAIQDAHFSEEAKSAQAAARNSQPHSVGFRRFVDPATLMIGGSNRQNVSVDNAKQRGKHYLLDSRPPTWASGRVSAPRRRSFFSGSALRWRTRYTLQAIVDLLLQDPAANVHTRLRLEALVNRVFDAVLMAGVEVRGAVSPGWSQEAECSLPHHQRCWLDPEAPGEPHWQEAVAEDATSWLMRSLSAMARQATRDKRDLPLDDAFRHECCRACREQLKWMEE